MQNRECGVAAELAGSHGRGSGKREFIRLGWKSWSVPYYSSYYSVPYYSFYYSYPYYSTVNDAPQGANAIVTTLEDAPYVFQLADFGFSDTQDAVGAQASRLHAGETPALQGNNFADESSNAGSNIPTCTS